ncbi:MAG: hypothetical protein GY702_05875, partial [Desulfobulbaceae bacterium]|nr:hypothetical protein [Desulfobulbaceae bacterium]
LEDNDPVVNSFINLGTLTDQDLEINGNDIPLCIKPFEKFVCATYDKKGATCLPALRWDLFRTRNLEGEKLPPTRASFIPHMQRANFTTKRDKSYTSATPILPSLDGNGWNVDDNGNITPTPCLNLPAPSGILELVKGSCKEGCTHLCGCAKNNLSCTALCKCFAAGCSNFKDYSVIGEEEEEENVDS